MHALFIDVNELTDRTENALKLVGDVYAARAARPRRARGSASSAWKDARPGQAARRSTTSTASPSIRPRWTRGELLELAIVFILVLELVLFFMGIMK